MKIKINDCYIYNESSDVWSRPDYQGIPYTDGIEVEENLKKIVDNVSDLSLMSVELANQCKDWVTTYHFSSKRANLLRPFEKDLNQKLVLEIGAGCGAITRFLAESGADVVALEGSLMRASIATSRCKGLENVEIVCDNFQNFESQQKFDVVTLVGVLEYSRRFVDGDDPISNMLSKAKSFLNDNGILIIAIENQLGLKYFAGFSEDHVQKPMYGIEDHYTEDGAVTFGKAELSQLVCGAGLNEQQWWYPFPDYKLPNLMVSEKGALTNDYFDLSTLVQNACAGDLQTPKSVSFIQERAWQPVIRNNLLDELSNSFLLLCSKNNVFSHSEYYALYYSTNRKAEFAKQVVFKQGSDQEISVHQSKVYPERKNQSNDIGQILSDDVYLPGMPWQDELMNIMTTAGWSVDSIHQWWVEWLKAIKCYADDTGKVFLENSVDDSLIDAMPKNMINTIDKGPVFFDLEWHYSKPLTKKFILFRSLLTSFQSMGICAPAKEDTPLNVNALIAAVLSRQDISITSNELVDFVSLEADIQLNVSGKENLNVDDFNQFIIRVHDTGIPASVLIDKANLAQSTLDTVEHNLTECQKLNSSMSNSHSWKITKPLRKISTIIQNLVK